MRHDFEYDPLRKKESPSHKKRREPLANQHVKKLLAIFPAYPITDHGDRWRSFGLSNYGNIIDCNSVLIRKIESTLKKIQLGQGRVQVPNIKNVNAWLQAITYFLLEQKNIVKGCHGSNLHKWIQNLVPAQRDVSRLQTLCSNATASPNILDSLVYLELTAFGELSEGFIPWLESHSSLIHAISSRLPPEAIAYASDAVRAIYITRCELPMSLQRRLLIAIGEPTLWRVSEVQPSIRNLLLQTLSDDRDAPNVSVEEYRDSSPSYGERLYESLVKSLSFSKTQRVAIYRLLNFIIAPGLGEYSRFSFESHSNFIASIDSHSHRLKYAPPEKYDTIRKELRKRFQPAVSTSTIEQKIARIFKSIEMILTSNASADELFAWRKLIETLPADFSEDYPCIPQFVLDCLEMRSHASDSPGSPWNIAWLERIQLVQNMFQRRGFPQSWNRLYGDTNSLDDDPIFSLMSVFTQKSSHFREGLDLLEKLIYDQGRFASENLIESIYSLLLSGFTGQTILAMFLYLQDSDLENLDCTNLLLMSHFTKDVEEQVRLWRQCRDDPQTLRPLKNLAQLSPSEFSTERVKNLILQGQFPTIRRISDLTSILKNLQIPFPSSKSSASDLSWIDNAPADLHASLVELAKIRVDAATLYNKLKTRWLPNSKKLDEELSVIERTLRNESDLKRLQSLIARKTSISRQQANHGILFKKAVSKIQREIQERFDQYFAEALCDSMESLISHAIRQRFPQAPLGRSIFESANTLLLAEILALPRHSRELGMQALLTGLSNERIDQLSHLGNRRFLERMQNRGIRMDPWLAISSGATTEIENGSSYRLIFCHNPIEILLMGHFFKTCLSPGSGHFSSTISIAHDINKRVLIGVTARGKIIGRRLFALTDDGMIQAFQCYFHDAKYRFVEASEGFAQKLSESMGTFLTTQGNVSSISLSNWYNDGAKEIASERSIESEDGFLARLVRKARPDSIATDVVNLSDSSKLASEALRQILPVVVREGRLDLIQPIAEHYLRFHRDPGLGIQLAVYFSRAREAESLHKVANTLSDIGLRDAIYKNACFGCEKYHHINLSFQDVFHVLNSTNYGLARRWVYHHRRYAGKTLQYIAKRLDEFELQLNPNMTKKSL